MGWPTCGRCRQPSVVATLEVFDDVGQRCVHLCERCASALAAFVCNQEVRSAMLDLSVYDLDQFDHGDEVDDAEHPVSCHCPECDPDFLFEYHRDERVA